MRCRHRQTSRYFEKSSKTGNHTLNCWHRTVKIPGKFKAQPKQPGYIRTPYTTVTFTNQVAKRSDIKGKMHITFPRCSVPICVGKPEGSYVRTEVKPSYGGYMVYVTFQDEVKTPEAFLRIPQGFLDWIRDWTTF